MDLKQKFGRKPRGEESGAAPAASKAQGARPGGKKESERLSSVIYRSVMGSAFDALEDCPAFRLPDLPGHEHPLYAVLALATADPSFGGLNRKIAKSNADKGQILELIKNDSIATVATEGMLARDVLGIIPSDSTLDRMHEFRILTNADYFWCVITKQPSIEDEEAAVAVPIKGVKTTWGQARAISDGGEEITSAVPTTWVDNVSKALGIEPPAVEPAVDSEATVEMSAIPDPETPAQAPQTDPVTPAQTQQPDPEPVPAAAPAQPAAPQQEAPQQAPAKPQQAPASNPAPQAAPQSVPAPQQAPPQQAPPQQAKKREAQSLPDVTNEDIEATLVRSVLREELDLKIDSRVFDQTFRLADLQVELPYDPEMSGWLGEHLKNLAEQGNSRLSGLRRSNLEQLYTAYVQMMGKHSEQVIADASTENKGSYFANLMSIAHADYDDLVAGRDDAVRELESGIRERFDAEAAQRGESARLQAEAQWRELNSGRLERQLTEAGREIDQQYRDSLADSERIILDLRRRTAHLRMDIGVTKVLDILVNERTKQMEEENKLVDELSAQMAEVLAENREADIQRVSALEKELGRDNSVKRVSEQYEASLGRLRQENVEARERREAELLSVKRDHEERLAAASATMNQRLSDQKEATEEAYRSAQSSKDAYDSALARIRENYEAEIGRLNSENGGLVESMNRQQEERKAGDSMRLWIQVGLGLVGFLSGGAVVAAWMTSALPGL